MILEFKFEYSSPNSILEKFLLRISKECGLEINLFRDGNFLYLYVEGNDKELENFANKLSLELPHSIYMKNHFVHIVEEARGEKIYIDDKKILSYCPKCLREINDKNSKNYYNPFTSCEICGYGAKKQKFIFKNFAKELESDNYQEIFAKIAFLIKNGAIIKLKTFFGNFFIGKIEKAEGNFDIICNDLATIQKHSQVSKEEILALGSIEKPSILLQTDLKNGFLNFRLPNDFILYLISLELKKLGIELFFITKNHINTKIELNFDEEIKEIKHIECFTSNNEVLILNQDRAKLKNLKDYEIPFVVAKEFNLLDKNICAIYLSKENCNKIMFQSPKVGFFEYLYFDFSFDSIASIFNEISNLDDGAKKLVENYKKNFNQSYKKIINIKFQEECFNLYKFWGVIAMILGYETDNNLAKASKVIELNSSKFKGKKGPRVDYKPKKIGSLVYLDSLKMVRSAMSFRLAGAEEERLSYGIVESFVDFLSNLIDDMKQDLQIDVVTINGSMLEIKPLFEKLNGNISKNHKLYFNQNLPIDK